MKKLLIIIILTASLALYLTRGIPIIHDLLQGRGSGMGHGLILANGRVEGDTVTIATRIPAKIVKTAFREGDWVEEGQVLARLDDDALKARRDQASWALEEARSALAGAKAALEGDRAALEKARKDLTRFEALHEEGLVPLSRLEEVRLAVSRDRARVQNGQALVTRLQKAVKRAEAALSQAEITLGYTIIRAPKRGVITNKLAEPGEVLPAGGPIAELVDLDQLYLKVFIPEKEIGKVRLDAEARIYTDAYPDEPVTAKVGWIASRAQFTPKEVQTPDERVRLVYGVKLYLDDNPGHRFTPGLPADAVIRWDPAAAWQRPAW